ncbi:hypothetical protein [Nocardiopsis sp. CNT312]|uniref:hypothetical protein n=1 Tax=Nocardiopsis sp. CNT312 TaxID=1137268 RepID=UPI00049071F7|nr:hypothetical protein [Nocardiopsis sp. CNT312]
MRKHRTRWVALLGAAVLSTTGAADPDPTTLPELIASDVMDWPTAMQTSTLTLDGFRIGYLPEGLDGSGLSYTSRTGPAGERRSQITWMSGPDEVHARVVVLRADHLDEIGDLRADLYPNLGEKDLELLRDGESGRESYVSEPTGHLFWLEEPGVGVSAHLAPERWDGDELRRVAEGITDLSAPAMEDGQDLPETGIVMEEVPAAEETSADAPAEDVTPRQVKECLVDRLTGPGGDAEPDWTALDWEAAVPGAQAPERPGNPLPGTDHDRLLAQLWYHSARADRADARDHCAATLGVGTGDVEATVAGLAPLMDEIITRSTPDSTAQSASLAPERLGPAEGTVWEEWWTYLPWGFALPTR